MEVPAAGRLLALPQDGDKVILLQLAAAPEGARWRLRKLGDKWEALLRLPPGAASVKVQTWVPFRSDPALLKELLAAP